MVIEIKSPPLTIPQWWGISNIEGKLEKDAIDYRYSLFFLSDTPSPSSREGWVVGLLLDVWQLKTITLALVLLLESKGKEQSYHTKASKYTHG
jgi:hypothetical protein